MTSLDVMQEACHCLVGVFLQGDECLQAFACQDSPYDLVECLLMQVVDPWKKQDPLVDPYDELEAPLEDEYLVQVHCHSPVVGVLNLENIRLCVVDVVSSNLMDAENHLAVAAGVVVVEAAELEVTVVEEVQYFFLEYGLAFLGCSAVVEAAKLEGILGAEDIEDDQHEALQEDLLRDYA